MSFGDPMFLIALFPPSNIRHTLSQVQTRVFREFGSPVALAIPPVVPLGFYISRPDPPAGPIAPQSGSLSGAGYFVTGNHVYLDLAPAEVVGHVSKTLPVATAAPLFPVLPGVPVGLELTSPADSVVTWDAPAIGWKTCRVVCLQLFFDPAQAWWDNLAYEECWAEKLKRKI